MIRLEAVTKSYRKRGHRLTLLDRASATFPRGRSVGLIGRNGAGKSTLLRMIGGSVEPDSGRIVREARVSWPLGLRNIFQPGLTGAQNARFIARIYGVDTDDMVEKVAAFSELGRELHEPTGHYSSGQGARLAFACSIAVEFDVYLVDEITAVGDQAFRKRCHAVFEELAETADLVMVSHNEKTLRDYCDAGAVLEAGRLRWFDDVEEALALHRRNMAD